MEDLLPGPLRLTVLNMLSIITWLVWLTLLTSASLCYGQRLASLSFSSEDQTVADFVQLPKSILALLLSDKEDFPDRSSSTVQCQDREHLDGEPRPEILCRRLPLSSQPGENCLVIGVGDLRGAHTVPFWLLHHDRRGDSLLLKTRSDRIEIGPKHFNGYAEVKSTLIEGAGATIVTDSFHFDGTKYARSHRQTQRQ
jgi:hypothetical protein